MGHFYVTISPRFNIINSNTRFSESELSGHGNYHMFVQGCDVGSLNLQDYVYAATFYDQTNGFNEIFVLTPDTIR